MYVHMKYSDLFLCKKISLTWPSYELDPKCQATWDASPSLSPWTDTGWNDLILYLVWNAICMYFRDILEIVMAALVDGERMQRSMGCEKAWWSNNLSIISHNGKNSWTKTTCSNWIVWPHGQIQIDNTASKRRRFIWEHPALTTNRSIDGNVMIQSRNQANVCLTWQIGYVHSWT